MTPSTEQRREWLTVREYAQAVQVSEITGRRHAYQGIIPSRKFGRALRIHVSAIAGPKRDDRP